MENLYLAHHGVQGQKWGVRRYQNRDGTLTRAGRKHRGISLTPRKKDPIKAAREAGKAARNKAKNDAKVARARAEEDAKLAKLQAKQNAKLEKIRDEAKSPEQRAAEKLAAEQRYGKTTFKNLDRMSDEELQQAIRRLQMEDQYRQLMGAQVGPGEKIKRQKSTKEYMQDAGNAGAEMVKKAMMTAGQEKMTDFMRYAMTKGINYLVDDNAITKDAGNKKAYLAEKEWRKHGYSADYDPKNGSKNQYSDAYSNPADKGKGAMLYERIASGKVDPHKLSDKDLKAANEYVQTLSKFKSGYDSYLGKGNGKGVSEARVKELIEEAREERD